jgi:large subunit ribosomal protein L12
MEGAPLPPRRAFRPPGPRRGREGGIGAVEARAPSGSDMVKYGTEGASLRFKMEYIYAALLLHKLGKPVNEESLTSVVKATGMAPDEVKIKALASALSEVNIDEALKNAATMAAAPAAAAAPGAAAAKAEEKPKEEEKKEEEALQGLASLFG